MLRNHTFTAALTSLAALSLSAIAVEAAPAKSVAPAARTIPVGPEPSMEDKFPQVPTPFAKGVTAWRDVTYKQQSGYRPQIVDIYVPAGKGPHPLVLYIHGGGWQGGHTRQSGAFTNFPQVLASLAAEGFTVASVEYRLSGEARFPAQIQDVYAALRFLRANAAKYHIDPKRVGVFGGSAGGHLAALAALTCHEVSLDPEAANDGCVQAAVAWYGIYDFATMPRIAEKGSAEQRLLGCDNGTCMTEQVRAASPLTYADAKDPPMLLIHGESDRTVPVAQTHEAEAALKLAGVQVKAIYYPGIDHSFMGKTNQETAKFSMMAANATFDFFHEKLGVPRR